MHRIEGPRRLRVRIEHLDELIGSKPIGERVLMARCDGGHSAFKRCTLSKTSALGFAWRRGASRWVSSNYRVRDVSSYLGFGVEKHDDAVDALVYLIPDW
jgi:hypothetical protein